MSYSKIASVVAFSAQVIICSVFVFGLLIWFALLGDDGQWDCGEANSEDNSTIV